MARLYRHSTAVAHVSRAICRRTSSRDAFLCGLLDVGFAAGLLAIVERPVEAAPPRHHHARARRGARGRLGLARPPVEAAHAIQQLVSHHHDVVVSGRTEQANAALVIAEQLCWEAGAGMLPPPDDADPMSPHTPEAPLEGIDVNWTGTFEEARRALKMNDLALGAARAEAFNLVAKLP